MDILITLFKDSRDSFLAALDQQSVAYNPVAALSGQVMASGTFVAIAQAVASSTAFAAIVVAWLKGRASRKIIVTTEDNRVFHLEGYSLADAEKILSMAARVTVIDTQKPDQPGVSDGA
jgi:hypothetical protein